jgi:hypothetical protein
VEVRAVTVRSWNDYSPTLLPWAAIEDASYALELPHGAHPEECEAELAEDALGYAPPRPVVRPVPGEWADTWEDEPAEELAVSTETFARRRFKQRAQLPLHVRVLDAGWRAQQRNRRRRSA